MSSIQLSIVIPVYNAELFLDKCINSALRQLKDEIEVIIIDDGSTDSSPSICNQFLKYDNVTVKHIENGGPSKARNLGIKLAKGRYISFLDSDDYISDNSILPILQAIKELNDVDVWFLKSNKYYPNGAIKKLEDDFDSSRINGKTPNEVVHYLSTRSKYPGSACTKIYRKEFLTWNGIFFPCNGLLCEDLVFVMEVLLNASVFRVADIEYYNYRQSVSTSRTKSGNARFIKGCMFFINYAIKLLTINKEANDEKAYDLMSFLAYEYCQILWFYSNLTRNEKKELKIQIQNVSWVLNYGKTRQTKCIRLIYNLFGIEITGKIINFVKKFI